MTSEFEQTERNRVRRVPNRGYYDRETVFQVIDVVWVGHVAFVDSASQMVTVIPMLHARDGDELVLHGARSSRLMKFLGSG
ncbi:MAG: pyridoxamine 5'-phosphate oxidase family protein, partial [Planctomycetaceae bacterium]